MYKINENNDLLKVDFENGISYHYFTEAVKSMLDIYQKSKYRVFVDKFKVIFREKGEIYNRRKKKEVKEIDLNFFLYGDSICYRIDKRTGHYVSSMDWEKVQSIELWKKDSELIKEKTNEKNQKFFNRVKNNLFDEFTWSNLNENDFSDSYETFYYLNQLKLSSSDKERIQDAFENKRELRIRIYKEKRDYTIETKMGEDGIFRAWFSSEYSGCGNGAYYLLLNPKVAVHYEND